MNSAAIWNGTLTVWTPRSFEDCRSSARSVVPTRIQMTAIGGVPGLRWKKNSASRPYVKATLKALNVELATVKEERAEPLSLPAGNLGEARAALVSAAE